MRALRTRRARVETRLLRHRAVDQIRIDTILLAVVTNETVDFAVPCRPHRLSRSKIRHDICRKHRRRLTCRRDLFRDLLDFCASVSQRFLAFFKLHARDEPVVVELFRLLMPFLQPFNFVFVESRKVGEIRLELSFWQLSPGRSRARLKITQSQQSRAKARLSENEQKCAKNQTTDPPQQARHRKKAARYDVCSLLELPKYSSRTLSAILSTARLAPFPVEM